MKIIGIVVLAIVAGAGIWWFGFSSSPEPEQTAMTTGQDSTNTRTPPGAQTVSVRIPELGQIARLGKEDFDNNCAACHGINAAGTENGPSFIHTVYRPGHHADFAFQRAVETGVRAHHWRFGNMPPQPQVSKQELARIVVYVRELQIANGIR